MAERLKASLLKSEEVQASVGSNPTPSAIFKDQRMKSFSDFLAEENEIKPIHQVLNKSQMKSVIKHPDFHTYVGGNLGSTVLARKGENQWNYSLANWEGGAKYRMDVTVHPKGKHFSHTIYKRDDNNPKVWSHVKSWSVDDK